MGIRVLLVEDDETIAEPLAEGLAHFGLAVDRVATGTDGLRGPYGDVVLLDLGLPDMDGVDVCRGIRRVSDVPIVILSARGEEADRVLGLELGADDYLAKPFSVRELVARVRAVTRRTRRAHPDTPGAVPQAAPPSYEQVTAPEPPPSYEPAGALAPPPSYEPVLAPEPPPSHEGFPFHETYAPPGPAVSDEPDPAPASGPVPDPGPLVVDRRTRQVWVGETAVALTPKEFDLLALLSEDPGAVYSRQQILDRVWDPHFDGPTKTLDVHVAALRRKLGHPAWIRTLRGVGFRLAVHPRPEGGRAASP
ncbi:response regulator transcription factor [Streptomyces sp. NPDC005931]|uniref:response regulator transcription factor n=1 Tax=Streptomyces sp. NPDC005931 TaxID=3364737 RepID=UPI00368DD8D0